jgi:hypothetical protein
VSGQLSISNGGQVEILTQAGYCEVAGGDGLPIRK